MTSVKRKTVDDDDDGPDLLQMMEKASSTRINMKEMPERNKRGKINYPGYMSDFFQEQPPTPIRNVVIDNKTLKIIQDLTGNFWKK